MTIRAAVCFRLEECLWSRHGPMSTKIRSGIILRLGLDRFSTFRWGLHLEFEYVFAV